MASKCAMPQSCSLLGEIKLFVNSRSIFCCLVLNMEDAEYALLQKLLPIVFAIQQYNMSHNERVSIKVAAALYALIE